MFITNWITTKERLPDVNWLKVLTTENEMLLDDNGNSLRDIHLRMFIKDNDENILLDNEWRGKGFYDYIGETWYKIDDVVAWQCIESPYTDDLYDENGNRKVIE